MPPTALKPYVPRDTPKDGMTLYSVNRRLTDTEWQNLKKWRFEYPNLAWRQGAPHPTDPSLVFRIYNRESKNGEYWTTQEKLDAIMEKNRNNYEKNKDRHRQSMARWTRENRERVREIARTRSKIRYATDPVYRTVKKLRALVTGILSRKPGYCADNHEKLFGCGQEGFFLHFKSLFADGMTLDNHGEWEADHIVPLSTATAVEDVERLFHISNLQPLWRTENMRKGRKIGHKAGSERPTHRPRRVPIRRYAVNPYITEELLASPVNPFAGVGRKLNKAEYAALEAWLRADPKRATHQFTVRESDGWVFQGYHPLARCGESWKPGRKRAHRIKRVAKADRRSISKEETAALMVSYGIVV